MGFFENITGTEGNMGDKDIAFDLLKDSKSGLTSLAMTIAESTNPQLRQILTSQFNTCVQSHHKLADMAVQKNWYPAFATPAQQVQSVMQDSQSTISQ